MRRLFFVALVCTLASAASSVPRTAAADDAGAKDSLEGARLDAALADVAKARKDLRTLRAAFTQTRKIALLSTSVASRGEMTFAAPDRLRWDLAPPDDVVYFIGPEGLTYKTKSSSATLPASSGSAAKGLADLRVLLGGDLAGLKERYVLGGSRSGGELEITGIAKDPAASVRSFALVLDRTLVVPLRARLLEGKSDHVEIVFSNAAVNGPVDAAKLKP